MMKKKIYSLMGLTFYVLSIGLFSACVGDPLDDEQYFNSVALVGSHDEYVKKDVSYGGKCSIFVSAYCGGTKAPGQDVHVIVGEADLSNVTSFNTKNVLDGEVPYEMLPKGWYQVPSYEGIIKSGERYVRIPIEIDADKIDADKRYMLPLKIVKSFPCPISQNADSVMLINFVMNNTYSGTYTMSGTETPVKDDGTLDNDNSTTLTATRVLTALCKNKVRFYHGSSQEDRARLNDNGIVLEINESSNIVTVSSWKDFSLVAGKNKGTYSVENGEYGRKTRVFTIEYDYVNKSNKIYHVVATLKSSE